MSSEDVNLVRSFEFLLLCCFDFGILGVGRKGELFLQNLETYGDWWLSGTDLKCDNNFQWCSINRGFVESEVSWKSGHPKAGFDCVYLEVRNGSMLLATANCAEKKQFLCEVRKAGTAGIAMQRECAETWDISSDEIDLLLNASKFLTANVSLNLKCFLKCVGVEVGMFSFGGLSDIAMLRNIELTSMEDPVKMERGFVAYDDCSGKKLDDECVTAYETYKCGQQKVPDIVGQIVSNNFGNDTVFNPPVPCVPQGRSCWMEEMLPCVVNQSRIDYLNANTGDEIGSFVKQDQGIVGFVSKAKSYGYNLPFAYKYCCSLGMKMLEPNASSDWGTFYRSFYGSYSADEVLVAGTRSVNRTHEVWCSSGIFVDQSFYTTNQSDRFFCKGSFLTTVKGGSIALFEMESFGLPGDPYDMIEMEKNGTNSINLFKAFVCTPK